MSEVRAYACRLLARREHSVEELRRKLEARWPGSDEVQGAIDDLLEEGLLSDRRFTEVFIRSRVARWQGPRKIRAELQHRGVNDADIDAALRGAVTSWTDLACQWLARKGGGLPDYEYRAKYYRRLINRGFTHDQAMDAVGGLEPDSEGV